ncbi:MAG TPA: PQQ-binding-like beta-propeller repeat protein [Acidobacteriaceae bacterium]|nr:PQQ-binding-like beta-propeller repeat protein [Acidobacteriaceae bacterium]
MATTPWPAGKPQRTSATFETVPPGGLLLFFARFFPGAPARLALGVLFLLAPLAAQAQTASPSPVSGSPRTDSTRTTSPPLGQRRYMQFCAGCHGADARGGDKAASLATRLSVITRSDAQLLDIVRNGTDSGMPPFAQLGDDNLRAIIRYLHTLEGQTAAAEKPQPPVIPAGVLHVTPADISPGQLRDNWTSYNGDTTGRRFSSLTRITPANVDRLAAEWVFHPHSVSPLEVTPVVDAGIMFVTSANDAYALDARTGKLLWHHARALSSGVIDDAAMHHNRGVAILGDRVYMETDNAHLLCLDARSGNLLWDVAYAPAGNPNYGATSAPLIVKNNVIVGSSGGDEGIRGFIAAYDAQTGKEKWRFWTIPGPSEKGNASWPGDMMLHGGGATWMPGTYDPRLNTLYWGTGNPSPDYDGSKRPGDDLYTSSLLALDPDTGRLKWYFQFSPHNLYDYDAVQTPVLVDALFQGRPRRLVVTADRNGFLYVLDRTTGQFLFAKQFAGLLNWAKGIDSTGRPISAGLIPDEKGVEVCPADGGATNWYAPSYDPRTRLFYFRSLDACALFRAKSEPWQPGHNWYSTGAWHTTEPRRQQINAFSLASLSFAWRDTLPGKYKGWSGLLSTASGLIAYGDDDQNFVIASAATGHALWHFSVGQLIHASPMTYAVHGRQYFAIAAGSDIFSFALPER